MYRELDKVSGDAESKVLKGYGTGVIHYAPDGRLWLENPLGVWPTEDQFLWDYTTNTWKTGQPSAFSTFIPFEPPYNRVGWVPILRNVTLEYQRGAVTEPDSAQVAGAVELLYGTSSVQRRKPRKPVYHPPVFRARAPKVPKLLSADSFGPMPSFSRLTGKNGARKREAKLKKIAARREAIIARVNSERIAVYNRRQSVFEGRYRAFLRLKETYEASYARRMLKHETRMRLWASWQDRYAKGYLRATGRRLTTSEHEFTRLRLRSDDDSPNRPEIWAWSRYDAGVYSRYLRPAGSVESPDGDNGYYKVRAKNIALSLEAGIHKFLDTYQDEIGLTRRLYSNLADQRVHIGNIIAERQQTFDMIVSLWRNISLLIDRKRSLLELTGNLLTRKGAANAILQFKFGVEPLVNDVMSAIELFETGFSTTSSTIRTHAKQSFREVSFPVGESQVSFTGYLSARYTAILNTDGTPARILNQLGLIDPSQIAWEVMPWSFVVDWFLPVGDWIMAQTSDVGLQSWVVMRSFRALGRFNLSEPAIGITDHEAAQQLDGTATLTGDFLGELKSRRFVPLPAPAGILEFKNPLSATHLIEAVALISQRFK